MKTVNYFFLHALKQKETEKKRREIQLDRKLDRMESDHYVSQYVSSVQKRL